MLQLLKKIILRINKISKKSWLACIDFFKHQTISVTTLTCIIAIYQASLLNLAYYKQIYLRLPLTSIENVCFFLSMPVVIFCVIFLILNMLYFRYLIKLASMLLVMVGAPLTYFMLQFSIVIDRGMLQNTLNTNQAEAFSYLTPSLLSYCFFLGIVPAIIIGLIKLKPVQNPISYFFRRLLCCILPLLIIAMVALLLYKNYAAFMRNNNIVIKYLLPSNYLFAIYSEYNLIKYRNLPRITLADDITQSKSSAKKTVFVVVVGETARAQNFSLNGYARNTNIKLAQRDDLLAFTNTSSCGTYTAYSVPCMFSNMARSQYDEKLAQRQDNLLDILQKAKIKVTWFNNNGGCQGVCNNVPYSNSTQKYIEQKSSLCSTSGTCFDQILVEELKNKLTQIAAPTELSNQDELIVLHMIGSHGPTYYQRYPDEFKIFTPTCDTNEINLCDNQTLVNTYDNTIAYTDNIINQMISVLEQYQSNINVGLIYISDHGESLGENGVYLHSLPYSVAPKVQTKIPFFMWLSPTYQQSLSIDNDCLTTNSKTLAYSHDNLFHTLLSSFNLQTKVYQSELDIFSQCQLNVKTLG